MEYFEPKDGVTYSPFFVDNVISSLHEELALRDTNNDSLTKLLAAWQEVRNRQDDIQKELRELLIHPGARPSDKEAVERLFMSADRYGLRQIETTDTNWYQFVSVNGEIVLAVPVEDVDE